MAAYVARIIAQLGASRRNWGHSEPTKPQMKSVESFKVGRLDAKDIARFTARVNTLIEEYNMLDANKNNYGNRTVILEQIQANIKKIDNKFKPDDIANSKEYLQARANLLQDIQVQYNNMGKTMSGKPVNSLSEIITSMPPDFANNLSELLSTGNNTKKGANSEELSRQLNALCDKYDAPDASNQTKATIQAFRSFMDTHSISYLGGGNSKNFLVTNNRTQQREVLKVDNRLDMPKSVEAHLRSKMPDGFTAVGAEQQVVLGNSGQKIGRTLLVTEYCTGGSVADYGRTFANNPTPEQIRKEIAVVFQQMSEVMLKIQAAGCFFPDAKITNWLIDEKGVRIADTKSFLFTDSAGNYSKHTPGNEYTSFLASKEFFPPEYGNDPDDPLKAESAHAYILGKNLNFFARNIEGVASEKIFKGSEGVALLLLITNLTKSDPTKRISLEKANNQLLEIGIKAVFSELKNLKIGANDPKMEEYILNKEQCMKEAANDPKALKELLVEVKSMADSLQNNEALKKINTIVTDFRDNSTKFGSYGMRAKAAKIEEAMFQVPIEERAKFDVSTAPETQKVMEALASRRVIGGVRDVSLTAKKEINEHDAAPTFKAFKDRFRKETAAPATAETAKKEVAKEADNDRRNVPM